MVLKYLFSLLRQRYYMTETVLKREIPICIIMFSFLDGSIPFFAILCHIVSVMNAKVTEFQKCDVYFSIVWRHLSKNTFRTLKSRCVISACSKLLAVQCFNLASKGETSIWWKAKKRKRGRQLKKKKKEVKKQSNVPQQKEGNYGCLALQ